MGVDAGDKAPLVSTSLSGFELRSLPAGQSDWVIPAVSHLLFKSRMNPLRIALGRSGRPCDVAGSYPKESSAEDKAPHPRQQEEVDKRFDRVLETIRARFMLMQ